MKADWDVKLLGQVVTLLGGGTPSKQRPEFWSGNIPWVSPKDMKSEIVADSEDHITSNAIDASATKRIPEGALLIVVRSGILARTIPTAISGRELTINQDLKALVPSDKIHPKFLAHFFRASEQRLLAKVTRGATVHKLDTHLLTSLPIPVPPLMEQQQIVDILDEAFEGLARARANAEANLQNARDLFESFLNDVFQAGSWPSKTLNEISDNLDRVRVPITKGDRQAGDIPYYGASGVVDYVADYLFDEDLLLVSEDGANLLARTYPIAFSISGKTWVNNHAHVLRFSDTDTQEFVRLYLNSLSLEPFVSGMAQPKLNQAQLNRIPIPFPSAAERTQIVAKAELFSADTSNLQQRYADAARNLDDLRQSLLQKAFAGELT